jgi:hypothetical protein
VYGAEQLIFGEGLGQVLLGPDQPAARPIEQAVLARQHDHRRVLEGLIVLDQRTGLISIQPRHHDVHENDVRAVIGNLGQSIETIDRRMDLATFLGKQGFGGSPNGLAIIDHEDLEPLQAVSRAFCASFGHATPPNADTLRPVPTHLIRQTQHTAPFNILAPRLPRPIAVLHGNPTDLREPAQARGG